MKKIIPYLFAITIAFPVIATAKPDTSPAKSVKLEKKVTTININTALEEEIDDKLIGAGPKIAKEIIKHRKLNGHFKSLEDLDKVKYIGSVFLKKNAQIITFK